MTKPSRGPKRPSVVSLICAAVAVVLSWFIVASKTNAQDPKPQERAKVSLAARVAAPASSAPVPAAAPAAEPAGRGKKGSGERRNRPPADRQRRGGP